MVIVRAMGGLGNQLQQYALYRKLEHMGKDARLDTSWFFDEELQAGMAAGRELELAYFDSLPRRRKISVPCLEDCGRSRKVWEKNSKEKYVPVLCRPLWRVICTMKRFLAWTINI